MERILFQQAPNFFEGRVSEYARAGVKVEAEDNNDRTTKILNM
jgi:hypothetical protein